jgi:hypothetical protein
MAMKVSDVVDVPMRGQVLRLKVTGAVPNVAQLAVGRRLRLRSPAGEEHVVRIVDHSVTGGVVTQKRMERVREFDVLIKSDNEEVTHVPVGFGYTVEPIE